ncbi:MAG TPA: NAD(P)H-quinone oxidoreductase [Gemmatimonadota bacterium]|nr:NAD(P)H-quinone oxidoreductase [Gemmatimonadota bacterium]
MRAIRILEPGGPEVLRMGEVPRPEPGPAEVRVRVRAAGVNRAEILQRRGHYPAPPGWPADVPGLEFAGEVETVGERVVERAVGDRVMGLVGGGGYAEFVVVHEREAIPVPESLSWEEAAAVPEVFVTAHDALFPRGRLRMGEAVLIHAVGSGVGTAAVQLARAVGARTLGTSRTEWKLERARELGLDLAIRAGAEDFADAVLDATGGRGVDLILDLVGGGYLPRNLASLASLGRIVVVGLTAGSFAEIDLGVVLRKRITMVGTSLRSRPLEEKTAALQAFARQALPLLADGRIRPVLDETFPMADAADAHRRMEANRNFGKIVLVW